MARKRLALTSKTAPITLPLFISCDILLSVKTATVVPWGGLCGISKFGSSLNFRLAESAASNTYPLQVPARGLPVGVPTV